MMEIIFIISLFFISYAFILYPISVYTVSLFRRHELYVNNNLPYVTVIIAAHNEEKRIKEKIENMLTVYYPGTKLQIIVASDGSSDNTPEIVGSYKEKGIELVSITERRGKENAQIESLKYAKGDIVVFTDVATMIEPNGIQQIVSNFCDPTIGCVSSEDRVIEEDGKQTGENFYVRYEMWLRRLESKANTPVGLSGSFFAARRIACQDLSGDTDSDFRILLTSIKIGMRGTCDSKAIGYYRDLSDQRREFDRKVRTVVRGLTLFFRNTEFLNILTYGLFSYQYFCHKFLRWMVPFFLIAILISNAYLAADSIFYLILFLGQIFFYGLAIISRIYELYSSKIMLLRIPLYFSLVNASILVAWWRYLRRQRIVAWTPSER